MISAPLTFFVPLHHTSQRLLRPTHHHLHPPPSLYLLHISSMSALHFTCPFHFHPFLYDSLPSIPTQVVIQREEIESLLLQFQSPDPYMAALVNERFASTNRVKVIQEDFTRCHLRSHLSSFLGSNSSEVNSCAKVVANIPFNISMDIVKQLLPMGDIFSEVVLLLQDEAALRMVDSSLRTSEYMPINIFINFYSDPEYKFKVLRANFFPQLK